MVPLKVQLAFLKSMFFTKFVGCPYWHRFFGVSISLEFDDYYNLINEEHDCYKCKTTYTKLQNG